MALLTKIQDPGTGIVGFTETGEEVDLVGTPFIDSVIYDYVPEGLIATIKSFSSSYWKNRRMQTLEIEKQKAREYDGYAYLNDIESLSLDYEANGGKCFAVTSLCWSKQK